MSELLKALEQLQEGDRGTEVPVILDRSLAQRIDQLAVDLARARRREADGSDNGSMADAPESVALADQYEAAKAEARAKTVVFTVVPVGRVKMRDLERDHEPSEFDQAEGRAWNYDTFPPALMAEGTVRIATADGRALSEGITVEEATVLWAEWPEGEMAKVVNTIFQQSQSPTGIPFGVTTTGDIPISA